MKPHKHKDLIIAWANGALIEYRHGNAWLPTSSPWWEEGIDYRIEPKPDVVEHWYVNANYNELIWADKDSGNLRLTFDGETGKLKAAEVING